MKRGYVLHHRPYRETSVIVNLLVDGIGRVDAVIRLGSGKRSLKSIVQPFQPLLFQLSGNSELKSLYQLEAASPAVPLVGTSLYAGMYLNELIVRCMSVQHGAETLFLHYHKTLVRIAAQFNQEDLRYFELVLLQELGCMPSLQYDTQGGEIHPHSNYQWLVDTGFELTGSHNGGNQHCVFSGNMLSQLEQRQLLQENLQQAKVLMRALLAPLLGSKPLASRQLFQGSKG